MVLEGVQEENRGKTWLDDVLCLTLNIPRVIFCDRAVTISTNLLLIFVCVPHQLEINIM